MLDLLFTYVKTKLTLTKIKMALVLQLLFHYFFLMNIVSFFMVNTKTKIRINVILKVSHESILQQTFMRHCISFISKKKNVSCNLGKR